MRRISRGLAGRGRGWSRLTVAAAIPVLMLCGASAVLAAATPSQEIYKKCMANLESLSESLKKFLAENKRDLPEHVGMSDLGQILGSKYLPHGPKPPVEGCKYFLMYSNENTFDFVCNLHGCLKGNEKMSIRYREYGFISQVNSRWKQNPRYIEHLDELRRWSVYQPTLVERLKYNYGNNPTSTLIIVVFMVAVLWYLYRQYFG